MNWTGYLKAQHLQRIGLDVACLRECFIQVRESSPGVFDLALLTEDMRKYVAEACATKTVETRSRSATPRKKTGLGKSKVAPLDQPDLLSEAD